MSLLPPQFENAVIFDLPEDIEDTHPIGIAAGDINDDTWPDIVVAHSGLEIYTTNNENDMPGFITVFRNTGNWTPTSAGLVEHQTFSINGPDEYSAVFDVALADIDGDGDPDLFVSAGEGNEGHASFWGVKVYRNVGGFFDDTNPIELATPLPVQSMVVTDIDNASGLDIAVTPQYDTEEPNDVVYVWLMDINGNYPSSPDELDLGDDPTSVPSDVAWGDYYQLLGVPPLYGSPGKELVVSWSGRDTYTAIRYVNDPTNPHFVIDEHEQPGECNNDGPWNSFALASGQFGPNALYWDFALRPMMGSQENSEYVRIFHGGFVSNFTHDCQNGQDTYPLACGGGSGPNSHSDAPIYDIVSGHLNGGAHADLLTNAVVGTDEDLLAFLIGRGDGTFAFDECNQNYFVSADDDNTDNDEHYPIRFVIVDLDRNGLNDIVTSNHERDLFSLTDDGTISVLINKLGIKLE